MATTGNWISAMRPRTIPLSMSGILVGTGIAIQEGFWDKNIFIWAMVTTVLFQLTSNLANDLGDGEKGTDNERRIGPMRGVQSGEISVKQMRFAVLLFSVFSLISSAVLIYFGTKEMPKTMVYFYSVLAIVCVIAAITYTVGKKAYGYNGMGDIMVFLFFGVVSVLGVYSLYSKQINIDIFPAAICVGLLSSAVLNLNNMRDIENDSASNKRTLVVIMGANRAKIYHTFLVVIGVMSFAFFLLKMNQSKLFISLLPVIFLVIHLRKVASIKYAKEFDPELKKVALSTFGISLLFIILTAI